MWMLHPGAVIRWRGSGTIGSWEIVLAFGTEDPIDVGLFQLSEGIGGCRGIMYRGIVAWHGMACVYHVELRQAYQAYQAYE
jgi:hypothetical protein